MNTRLMFSVNCPPANQFRPHHRLCEVEAVLICCFLPLSIALQLQQTLSAVFLSPIQPVYRDPFGAFKTVCLAFIVIHNLMTSTILATSPICQYLRKRWTFLLEKLAPIYYIQIDYMIVVGSGLPRGILLPEMEQQVAPMPAGQDIQTHQAESSFSLHQSRDQQICQIWFLSISHLSNLEFSSPHFSLRFYLKSSFPFKKSNILKSNIVVVLCQDSMTQPLPL